MVKWASAPQAAIVSANGSYNDEGGIGGGAGGVEGGTGNGKAGGGGGFGEYCPSITNMSKPMAP